MIKRPEQHMAEQGTTDDGSLLNLTSNQESRWEGEVFARQFVESQGPAHSAENERVWTESLYKFVDITAIIVSGPPGSGSSSLSDMLAVKLGIREEKFKKIGELRRMAEEKRRGTFHIEDMERDDPEMERRTDEITKREIRRATYAEPALLEAQLGGFIGVKIEEQQEKNRQKVKDTAKILLTVDPLEGGRRVRIREEQKTFAKIEELTLKALPVPDELYARLGHSDQYWTNVNATRHAKDLRGWRKAYPELRLIDPHDTQAVDRDGKPVWQRYYDYKLDSTFADLESVCNQVILSLLEQGHIAYRNTRELKKARAEKTLQEGVVTFVDLEDEVIDTQPHDNLN